jgi:hypothetical protein
LKVTDSDTSSGGELLVQLSRSKALQRTKVVVLVFGMRCRV